MSTLTTFSLEYVLSVSSALLVTYLVNRSTYNVNPILTYFIVPLTVAFIMLKLMNMLFPGINYAGRKTYSYLKGNTMERIYEMNYLEIFPPLFSVLIIIVILLVVGVF